MKQTEQQKKDARREVNHAYYTRNSTKWRTVYPKSTTSKLGTGNLGMHKLDDEYDEMRAVRAELIRLGLKSVYTSLKSVCTKVHTRGK